MSTVLRTLQNFRDGVADVADVNVAASGVRHTNALVDRRINIAVQKWRRITAESGDDSNLKTTTVYTNTATTYPAIGVPLTFSPDAATFTPTADDTGLPANRYILLNNCRALFIRGIDIFGTNSQPIPMYPFDELERDDAALLDPYWISGMLGRPAFYRMQRILGDFCTVAILPWADAVYRCEVRYIPAHADLVNGTDTVDVLAGGEEWIINDAAMQTLRNDGLASTAEFQSLLASNAQILSDLRFMLAKRQPPRKMDTVARRYNLERWGIP